MSKHIKSPKKKGKSKRRVRPKHTEVDAIVKAFRKELRALKRECPDTSYEFLSTLLCIELHRKITGIV